MYVRAWLCACMSEDAGRGMCGHERGCIYPRVRVGVRMRVRGHVGVRVRVRVRVRVCRCVRLHVCRRLRMHMLVFM